MSNPTLSLSLLSLLFVSIVPIAQANQTLSYTYNNLGLITSIDGPRLEVSDITTFTYDASGNRTSVTNALGHTTQISAYDLSGRPLTIIDANGATTQLTYDVRGRLVSQDTAGRLTSFSYNLTGNITQISQGNDQVLTYHYDSAHRPIGYSDALGNKVTYVLDAAGNQLEQTITDPSGTLTQTHRYIVDELNRLRSDIGAESQTATLDYDSNNNLTEQTDPNGNPTGYAFDALDRLIESTDADNGQTSYHYDDRDNLTFVTDARGSTTSYHYDTFDNLIEQTSPDTGITLFTYDEANNRLSQSDARGSLTTYQYDALNRITHINYADTSLNVIYHYDDNSNNQYGIGRLTSQTDNSGTTFYAYDVHGNLISQTQQTEEQSHTLHYAYNDTNQLSQLTYPDDSSVDYLYDNAGRLIDVNYTDSQGMGQNISNNMSYQPFGPMSSQSFGNGLTSSQINDLDYRQTQLITPNTVERNYDFDLNSNIINITDLLDNDNSQYFNYDVQNRLELAGSTHYGDINYLYDATHNRISKYTLLNALTLHEDYDYALDSNQLLSKLAANVTHYQYDANGNMTDNGTFQFSYGQDNRLHNVSQNGQSIASYSYNAQGQRSSKTVNNKTTYFLYNQSGQLLTEISQGQGQQLAALLNQAEHLQSSLLTIQLEHQGIDRQQQALQTQIDLEQQQLLSTQSTLTDLVLQEQRQLRRLAHSQRIVASFTRWQQRYVNTRWARLFERWITRYQQRASGQQTQLEQTQLHITEQEQTIVNLHTSIEEKQLQLTDVEQQFLVLQQQQHDLQLQLDDINLQTVELEQDGEPTQTHYKHYLYANGGLTAIVENDQVYAVHNDHLGTPQTITDTHQDIVWQASYTPFGQATILTQSLENNIRFPGQYYDSETKLHYNYFRYYDPSLGRYITSDPIGLAGGINTYGYVEGNPLMYSDPYGLINPTKYATGLANTANAMKKSATAVLMTRVSMITAAMGQPQIAIPAAGLAAYNAAGAKTAAKRGGQQMGEGLAGCWDDASTKNLLGVLPMGTEFDDIDEPWPWEKDVIGDKSASELFGEAASFF